VNQTGSRPRFFPESSILETETDKRFARILPILFSLIAAGPSIATACGDWTTMANTSLPSRPYTEDPFEYNEGTIAASTRTCAMLISQFRPHLSEAQISILNTIDISISPSLEAHRVFASGKGSTREIEISIGFVSLISLLSDMMVFQDLPNAPLKADDYINYVTEIALSNFQSETSRQHRAVSFPRFLGLSLTEEHRLYSDPTIHSKRVLMYVETLAIVLAHELAHHFYNHVDSNATLESKRANEAAADHFAVDLVIKSGHQPFLGIFPFWFFVKLEEIRRVAPHQRDHPDPACRLGEMVTSGIQVMRADNGFIDQLRKERRLAIWNEQMEKLGTSFREHCGSLSRESSDVGKHVTKTLDEFLLKKTH
jgi:hypothetical protein